MFTWAQVMVEEERYRDKVRKAAQKRQKQQPAHRVEVKTEQGSSVRPSTKQKTSHAGA